MIYHTLIAAERYSSPTVRIALHEFSAEQPNWHSGLFHLGQTEAFCCTDEKEACMLQ